MKRPIISFLLLLITTVFFSTNLFAGEPIPGVNVSLGKNPGGAGKINTRSGSDGRFSMNVDEGSYMLTLSYEQVLDVLKHAGKANGEVTLLLNAGTNKRVLVNDKVVPVTILITGNMRPVILSVPKGGAIISGAITFEKTAVRPAPVKK